MKNFRCLVSLLADQLIGNEGFGKMRNWAGRFYKKENRGLDKWEKGIRS